MIIRYCIVLTLFLTGFTGCAQENNTNSHTKSETKPNLITKVVEVVKENHISPKELNDELSKEIFTAFLQKIDPEKKLFTLDEVDQLKAAEQNLDDELKNGTTLFFSEATDILFNGIERAEKYVTDCLANETALFKDQPTESYDIKREFVGPTELKKKWEFKIRKQFFGELYITEIVDANQSFDKQKSIAFKKTKLFFQDYFYELKSQSKEDILEDYINAYLFCNDYQSNFLSPKSKAIWDRNFNRNFVGVGLRIETTIDYPKINNVFFNGPAWKTNKINAGDILMKVSNKENELIDVAGFPLKKVIDLIKGEKDSKVSVTIKKPDNTIEEVVIARGKVFLSKTMSFVINEKNSNSKIGYIYLPRFYSSDEGCAADVLDEIIKLKKQNVEGLILDLRNNIGGSVGEVIQMVGYFLNGENVMQMVKNGHHRTREDNDSTAQYSGKLIVMVNERSSSASELLSGNLQDYQKAIIVGSQTFGKGTSQNFFEILDEESSTKLGDVKLTVGSFYTGNGRTPQYNGIVPDIILPTENKYVKTGERTQKNALQFENLEPTIAKSNIEFANSLNQLEKRSKARQATNTYFQKIEKKAQLKKSNESNTLIQLNYNDYKKEKEKLKVDSNKSDLKGKLIVSSMATSKLEEEKTNFKKSLLENDAYLFETLLIMKDYLQIES